MILLRKKDNCVTAIKKVGGAKAGKNEREIQSMLHRYLPEAFPELIPLMREYPVGGGRIDTVAFDIWRSAFAVIEYKNVKGPRAVEQGLGYRNRLQNSRERTARMYYEETKKHLDPDGVDWDGTRMIFIAPGFDDRQRASANASIGRGAVIEMYEITTYEGGIVSLERVCDYGEPRAGRRGSPRPGRPGAPGAGATGRAARARSTRKAADPSQVSEVVARCLRPGRPKTLAEIYRAVEDAGLGGGRRTKDAVRGVLSYMREKGEARSVSRGVWQAVRAAAPGTSRKSGRGARAGARRASGITAAVEDFLATGGPKTLAEIYDAVAGAGHGSGRATRDNVRSALYRMMLNGKVRRGPAGVYRSE